MNKKLFMLEEKKEEKGLCGHGSCNNPAQTLHTCPFSSEIHGDDESLCDCCEDCEHECAMDI